MLVCWQQCGLGWEQAAGEREWQGSETCCLLQLNLPWKGCQCPGRGSDMNFGRGIQ